ncbi:MAG TPA: hypothetical protein DEB39_07975 [Planctomycetaceae bacterium]|nr:hypothetical protein [Planctomycetaceae bacterium]
MKTVNPLHRSDQLHRDAGTFYRSTYADADRVYSLFDSFSWANQLVLDDALDASKLFVRTLIPPLHRERFLPLRLWESMYRDGSKKINFYGDENLRYGDAVYYGHPSRSMPGAVELPSGVVDVDLCCDLPVDPSVVLIRNEHFFIRGGHLFFTVDPFDCLPVSEGPSGDRFVTIYLRGVAVDRRYVQDRLGVLLQTQGPSTAAFCAFNNLALDCVMDGTSRLPQLLGKLYGVPCTSDTETVEQTGFDLQGRWLATGRTVYFAPLSASFSYKTGETVQAGTVLTDAIRPVRGTSLADDIPIVFERRFLGSDYRAGLIFPNEDVPLTLEHGVPTFRIVGREDDVKRFWNSFYERTDDRGILSAAVRGGRINPARFVYENVLYPRSQIFLVRRDRCGPNALPVINTQILRGLVPPGILFSILLVAPNRTLTLDPPKLESARAAQYHAARNVTCPIRLTAAPVETRTC